MNAKYVLEDEYLLISKAMSHFFNIWPILEARAEIQKYFWSFFGSNEDKKNRFWNYLTFNGSNFVSWFLFEIVCLIVFFRQNDR